MSETVFPQPQNVLDSTVARIASAVENMVPSNVCVNISTSLLPADWSSSAPYIQVWTNNKVTDECAVKVEFPAEAASTNVTYLEFEKVAGGVKFTAPVKPATAIPVIVHIINAEAESITDISADLVSTSAVPNASNVEEGLETLNSDVTALNSKIANSIIFDSLSAGVTYTSSSLMNGSMIFIWWNDNTSAILMKTNSNRARTIYNTLEDFTISCDNNVVSISNTKSSSNGNITIIQRYE